VFLQKAVTREPILTFRMRARVEEPSTESATLIIVRRSLVQLFAKTLATALVEKNNLRDYEK